MHTLISLHEFLISYPITNSPFINNMGSFNLEIKNYGQVFQIYPNSKQKQIIFDNFNASRFIYNKTLEDNIFSYKEFTWYQCISVASHGCGNAVLLLCNVFKGWISGGKDTEIYDQTKILNARNSSI